MQSKENKTKKNSKIEFLYEREGIDMDEIYEKTQKVLDMYRMAKWLEDTIDNLKIQNHNRNRDCTARRISYCADELRQTISGWDDVKPQEFVKERKINEDTAVLYTFQENNLIYKINEALIKVYRFPKYGKLYTSILRELYISKEMLSQKEIMEKLDIQSNTAYAKKRKDAILLLGYFLNGKKSADVAE